MLILLGLRASGKTTLGRALAERTDRPFTDLDDATAARLGCPSASDALTRHGLAAFRSGELAALRELLASASPDHIIALGGGTPTIPEAADAIRTAPGALRVYLRATCATLQERLRPGSRPPLVGQDAVSEVPLLLAQRDPLYLELADQVLNIDSLTPAQALVSLERLLK